MNQKDLALIDARLAAEVCRRTAMSDQALALLDADLAPRLFLDRLIEHHHDLDGIRFLAHSMVKRAVVWWVHECVAGRHGPEPDSPAAGALAAARAWVIDPSDDRRRDCFPAAEAAGIGTPAGCAAMAAFLSGGSLAPPSLQAVLPAEDLTGRMAIGALSLLAVAREPEKAGEAHAAFLKVGYEIADGLNVWPSPPRTPPTARPPIKKK